METAQRPRRTARLARISDARNGDEAGVDRQAADTLALTERLGWGAGPAETHLVTENDTSAFTRRKVCRSCLQPSRSCTCPPLPGGAKRETALRTWRPGFRRVLSMLQSGEADGLVAYDLDRAVRDPRDLEDLIDVVESRRPRIPVESVTGSLRLANDAGVMVARVMTATANAASRDTARRVARKRQEQAERGEYGGGRRPFGFEADGVTVTGSEAAEIRRAADQVLAGVSLRTICADLRARGVPTVKGGKWDTATLRDILLRPRNAGLAVYGVREAARAYRERGEPVPVDCGVTGPASWPAILPEEQWRAVAVLLTDPARRTTPGNTPRWLGSLIYQCGVCAQQGTGETCMVTGALNGRGPSYVCRDRGGGHLRRAALRTDEFVEEVLIRRLAQPDAVTLVRPRPQAPDRAGLASELAALRERAAQLAAAFADGAVTVQQLRTGSERLNGRIRETEAVLAAAAGRSPLDGLPLGTERVREVWERLPLGARRAVLRTLADVTLHKGRPGRMPDGSYFDPGSVEITWKS